MENQIKLNKEIYNLSEPIKVDISSKYMFGALPANLNTEIHYTAVSKNYENEKFKNFSFTSDIESKKKEFEFQRQIKYSVLDRNGQTKVLFINDNSISPPSILQGMITAIVFDDGRPVSAYKKFDIYPYKHMVGIYRHGSGFIEPNQNESFTAVLIDPISSKEINSPLKITLYKNNWYQIYDSSSAWGYRWEKSLQKVNSMEVKSGKTFKLKINDTGEYTLVASDVLGGHKAATNFYVGGWTYDMLSPRNDMRKLDIVINNNSIKKGDELKVQIKSPISGKLLITLESDKIYKYKVLNIDKNTAFIKIPIDFNVNKGIYVSAMVIRDTSVDDPILPYRTFGSEFIKANLSNKIINISVNSKKIIEPGKVKISILTDGTKGDNAVISIVDYGIINIIRQKPINVFKFFYRLPILQMALYDFYDNLSNHYKITPKMQGAGNVSKLMAARMKKFLGSESINERVKPLSIFSGLLDIDEKGNASFIADIPSFNGKARVEAIVIGKNRLGSNFKDMIIREPISIKPVYPRFLIEGDNLNIPLRFFNNLSKNIDFRFTVSSTKEVKVSYSNDRLQLQANEQIKIPLRLKAISNGNAKINISVFMGEKVYTNNITIPVKSKKMLVTKVFSGETNKELDIEVPEYFKSSPYVKADINLNSSYVTRFNDIFKNLVNYPYGCLEQTVSRLFSMLYMDKFLDKNNEKYKSLFSQRDFYIEDGIRKLQSMQRYDGKFLYWPYGNTINDYASIYAMDFLISAEKKGYKIPDKMLIQGLRNLNRQLTVKYKDKNYNSDFLNLYSAYVLSRKNKLKRSYVNYFYDKSQYKNNLPATLIMASTLNRVGLRETASKVKKYAEKNFNKILSHKIKLNGDFYSYDRDLAFALFVYLDTFGKSEITFKWLKILAENKNKKLYYSTQETAFILRAIQKYYQNEKITPIDVTLVVNGKTKRLKKYYSDILKLKSNTIKILPNNSSNINYSVGIIGFKDIPNSKEIDKSNKYIKIDRNFYNSKGELADLNNLQVGELLYAQIKVISNKKVDNLVIANLIPSCFEIVNKRLEQMPVSKWFKNSKNYRPDYVDIRDDRVLTFLNVNDEVYFYQPLRVVSSGTCTMPYVYVEAMYNPEWQDYDKKVEEVNILK